ncbi:HTH-type transcriptional regulator CynR [Marinomonas spartinae]|uniref:LysR family transcriptional regulator n=1 Tax=Marinomonas spartinae TaxID=1792290 RepID=UPI000808C091|nr:LysR substrate-binding domain-containing protein [Marinomonas spartinae]SBS31571.1 HTH-type transcriptional regulator CynR [Marinomonas spartinae]
MELRQFRYFLKVVECGSLGKAALELDVGTSALSQQISKLENELATRLLNRTSTGALPTSAGIAFMHHAQLAIRQAEQAAMAAQKERTSGYVSIGMPPTTATVLALPLIRAIRENYPHIHLHIIEMLSGHLENMLNTRQLDLAILFHKETVHRWSTKALLDEELFLISSPEDLNASGALSPVHIKNLADIKLIMPSGQHGLRTSLMAAFERYNIHPNIIMEIDGLTLLMDTVHQGFGATIQPGAAAARFGKNGLSIRRIEDNQLIRRNYLVSLPDDDLSPSALAARATIIKVAKDLVNSGIWSGANWIG